MSAAPGPVSEMTDAARHDAGAGPGGVRTSKTGPSGDGVPGPWSRLAGNPRAMLLVAAVLVAIVSAAVGGTGAWPDALTVDVRSPLDDLNRWLVDNRTTHPCSSTSSCTSATPPRARSTVCSACWRASASSA